MKKLVLLFIAAVFTLGLALPAQAKGDEKQKDALFDAINNRRIAELEKLIKAGADINKVSEDFYEGPLHGAVRMADLEIVKILLENGADANIKDNRGRTPIFFIDIFYRPEYGIEIAKLLIDNGADIYASDNYNKTVFHFIWSYPEVSKREFNRKMKDYFEFLFSQPKNIDLKGISSFTPLHAAAGENSKRGIDFLLSKGVDINVKDSNGLTPINYAEGKEARNFLITKGAKIDNLPSAVISGKLKLVKKFLANGADINIKGYNESTPLMLAVANSKDKISKYLISQGADVKAKNLIGKTSLHYATREGSLEIVKLLLENGADINAQDEGNATPLYYAVAAGEDKVVEYLLSKGANPNVVRYDLPALWKACQVGDIKIVESLLKNGANANCGAEIDSTPIDATLRYCEDCSLGDKEKILRALIKYGADINAPMYSRGNALDEFVVLNPKLNTAKLLFKLGADVNKGTFKNFYVSKSSYGNNKKMIKLLLENGANINAKDNIGKTPLDYAKTNGMKKFLIKRGAKYGKDLK